MRIPLAIALALATSLVTASASAQPRDDGGLWLATLAQGRLAAADSSLGNFRWWLEAQARWRNEGEDLDMAFFRPALGYALSPRATAFVGYGLFDIDPAGAATHLEHRVWEQLSLNLPIEGFALSSRTRLEQRFVEDESETGDRLRQQFKAMVPLTESKATYVSIFDEGFFDLNDTDWGQRAGFRQNRAFLGLGVYLDSAHKNAIEVGYLNQWIDKTTEDGMNHILSISLFLNF